MLPELTMLERETVCDSRLQATGRQAYEASLPSDDYEDMAEELPMRPHRKPYTATKQREKWSDAEHERFVEAVGKFGRDWKKIQEHVGTRTATQLRSHAQKFFAKLEKQRSYGHSDDTETQTIEIPPARPKRKPVPKSHRPQTSPSSPSSNPPTYMPPFGTNGDSKSGSRSVDTTAVWQQLSTMIGGSLMGGALSGPPASSMRAAQAVASGQEGPSASPHQPPDLCQAVSYTVAAASVAAAQAAASVVQAAGPEVAAHMLVQPPLGFPFFGVAPQMLMSAVTSSFGGQIQGAPAAGAVTDGTLAIGHLVQHQQGHWMAEGAQAGQLQAHSWPPPWLPAPAPQQQVSKQHSLDPSEHAQSVLERYQQQQEHLQQQSQQQEQETSPLGKRTAATRADSDTEMAPSSVDQPTPSDAAAPPVFKRPRQGKAGQLQALDLSVRCEVRNGGIDATILAVAEAAAAAGGHGHSIGATITTTTAYESPEEDTETANGTAGAAVQSGYAHTPGSTSAALTAATRIANMVAQRFVDDAAAPAVAAMMAGFGAPSPSSGSAAAGLPPLPKPPLPRAKQASNGTSVTSPKTAFHQYDPRATASAAAAAELRNLAADSMQDPDAAPSAPATAMHGSQPAGRPGWQREWPCEGIKQQQEQRSRESSPASDGMDVDVAPTAEQCAAAAAAAEAAQAGAAAAALDEQA